MKKVIIIGATSGIGLELAKLFVQNGDKVGVTGRRCNLLEQLKLQFPYNVETECFDVTGTENMLHLESLIKKLDGLDVLIYNSGYGEVSRDLNWEIDKQTTLTNVNGFVEIVNYTFNYYLKKSYGHIAATSSIASIIPARQAPAYNASKSFMSMYMAGLYLKAARIKKKRPEIDITITDIQPGFVKTKMTKGVKRFWEAPVEKAAIQIFNAIKKKKRKVYITKRWAIVAWLLQRIPFFILKKLE